MHVWTHKQYVLQKMLDSDQQTSNEEAMWKPRIPLGSLNYNKNVQAAQTRARV